jgi:polyisoprenoid-binding protein YceI
MGRRFARGQPIHATWLDDWVAGDDAGEVNLFRLDNGRFYDFVIGHLRGNSIASHRYQKRRVKKALTAENAGVRGREYEYMQRDNTQMNVLEFRFLGAARWAALGLIVVLVNSCLVSAQATHTPISAPELMLTLDPAQCKVHWTVDSSLHTVHGSFDLKSGTLHLDRASGRASGEIVVLASSGQSGNGSRDKRMHKEILETATYPEAVFRPSRVEGKVGSSGASDVKLTGLFSIHGADHELTASVHAEITGDRWHGTSTFQVPYVNWGIKNPSNFLLKVKPVVDVEVEMSGNVKSDK